MRQGVKTRFIEESNLNEPRIQMSVMAQHDDKETEGKEGKEGMYRALNRTKTSMSETSVRSPVPDHIVGIASRGRNSHEGKTSQEYVWMVLCAKLKGVTGHSLLGGQVIGRLLPC